MAPWLSGADSARAPRIHRDSVLRLDARGVENAERLPTGENVAQMIEAATNLVGHLRPRVLSGDAGLQSPPGLSQGHRD